MIKLSLIFSIIIFFSTFSQAYALDAPQITSPISGSSVGTTKIEWSTPSFALYPTNPYRIQVDDDSSFGSPNKDYNTDNTYYTPVLDPGSWNTRVKVKDSTGTWTDWGSAVSFNYSTLLTPSPTPTSEPSPSNSPSPSPSPAGNPQVSAFEINASSSQLNVSDTLTVTVTLNLPNSPSTAFFIKGAFIKTDGSNYFGETQVGGNWVKNGASYSSQLPITTDVSGSWTGTVQVKADPEDSGYIGNNSYYFKVGRYNASGSGPTWSNQLTLSLSGNAVSASPSPKSSSTPKPSATATPKASTTSVSTTNSISRSNPNAKLPSEILGASASANTNQKPPDNSLPTLVKQAVTSFNPGVIAVAAGVLILLVASGTVVYSFKKH